MDLGSHDNNLKCAKRPKKKKKNHRGKEMKKIYVEVILVKSFMTINWKLQILKKCISFLWLALCSCTIYKSWINMLIGVFGLICVFAYLSLSLSLIHTHEFLIQIINKFSDVAFVSFESEMRTFVVMMPSKYLPWIEME